MRLADGGIVVADPAYLTRSMMDPEAEMVAGYPPLMPTFQGRLTPGDTAALIELIHALDRDGAAIAPLAVGRAALGPADLASTVEARTGAPPGASLGAGRKR